MTKNDPNKTLADLLGITEGEICERKQLLEFTREHEEALAALYPAVELVVDDVIEDFYAYQLNIPAIRALIGDRDTLNHLKGAMHGYVLGLFGGDYGLEYAAQRLRVGRVHSRIGIPSKYYVSALHKLISILGERLEPYTKSHRPPVALRRLLMFDLQLTFDTYVHGLMAQVEAKNDELVIHSQNLERIVEERTQRILRLSRVDGLTGLENRAVLDETLDHECARALQGDASVGLVFMDIDGFKQTNDEYGHAAGDQVLRKVAWAIKKCSVEVGQGFRFGGDEFCVLMPGAGVDQIEKFVPRVSANIAQELGDTCSVSIGWAISTPTSYLTARELIRKADSAMYDVKRRRKVTLLETSDRDGPAVPSDVPADTRVSIA